MKIFIPIKEHSARIPNKNFLDFAGVPLWKHLVQKLTSSVPPFDIYIDTDSEKILAHQGTLSNVTIYKRFSRDLPPDGGPVNDLIRDFFKRFDIDPREPIVQTHVTSPLLSPRTILDAVETFNIHKENVDSILSVDTLRSRAWRMEPRGKFVPINHVPSDLEPTQGLDPIYIENSAFYIFTKDSFFQTRDRIGKRPMFFPIDFPENIDIDEPKDLSLARREQERCL